MISWSKCRPLNRSFAEVGSVIPAVIAGYRAFQQFAAEPLHLGGVPERSIFQPDRQVASGDRAEPIENTDVRPLTNDARREVLQSCEGQALACLRGISVILVYIERIQYDPICDLL